MRKCVTRSSGAGAECTVRGALALIVRLSHVFGLAPVRVKSKQVMRIELARNYYGYILLFTMNAFVISGVIIDLRETEKSSAIVRFNYAFTTWCIDITLLGIIVAIGVHSSRSRIETIINCLNILEKIHPEPVSSRISSRKEMKRYCLLAFCILLALYQVVTYFILLTIIEHPFNNLLVINKTKIILYPILAIEQCMAVLLELQFLFITLEVNSALEAFNNSAQTLLTIFDMQSPPSFAVLFNDIPDGKYIRTPWADAATKTPNINTNIYKNKAQMKPDLVKMVRRLISSFGQICDVVDKVNDSFEVQLMVKVCSLLFFMIVMPFSIVNHIVFDNETNGLFVVLAISAILIQFSHVVAIVEPGNDIQQKMRVTRMLTSQLMGRAVACKEGVAFQLVLLGKLVRLSDPRYSFMGVCQLSRTLLIEMFGVVTTFITIFLQFQGLDKI